MGFWLGLFLVSARMGRADESILMVGLPALYHPIIEIGYGLEFGLPGLVPVALAQAAGSTDWLEVFFLKSESEARTAKVPRLLSVFVFQGIDIGSEGIRPRKDAQSATRRDSQR